MRKTVLAALFYLVAFPLLADEGGYYFKLALNQYLASDYKEALSNLQMGVREDSRDWKIRQLLGYCAYQMNDNQDALAQCQESLRLHGDNPRLENFVKWLSVPEPRAARKKDEGAYLEGREAAQMPDPPDLNPGGKSDIVLQGLTIPTPAPPPDARNDLFKNVLFQVGPGSEFFGQNFNSHGAVGLGGELAVGYSLDDHWSFWWTGAMYLFQQNYLYYYGNYWYRQSYQIPNMEMTLSARYSFGDGPFQPYVGAGAGFYAGDSFYDIQHLIQGSLGARLKLDEALSLFAEARGNFITFQQSTAIDYPVNAGVILDFWGDKGGQGEAVSPPPDGDFFIKTGLGLTFGTDDYPYATSISVNATSFAAGYDFPNHFSFFTSLERFPGDWAVLANLQYNLWLPVPCQPYLFIGAGLDFPDGPAISNVNNAGQVGLGLDFNLNRALDLFFEAKAYDANNLFKFVDPYQVGTNVFETGLKFNLSATRNPVPPTPLETLRAVPGQDVRGTGGGDRPSGTELAIRL